MSNGEGMDAAGHDEARLALPWLANGTLGEAEAARVADHLARCAACRAELAAERQLYEAIRAAAAVAPAPHPVQLVRLWERIDGTAPTPSPRRVLATPGSPAGWRWLVAAQAAAILLLGVLALAPRREKPAEPGFRTLSAAPAERSPRTLRVVFADSLDQRRLREILLPLGAEIVGGPSPLGVYTLALPAGDATEPLAWVVAHLRALPEVRFAEPATAHDGR